MRKTAVLLILTGGLLIIANTYGNNAQNDSATSISKAVFTNVSHEGLNEMLLNKDFLLVNVHVPYEGNLLQTNISLPYNKIGQYFTEFLEDKNARIVVYCSTGSMSIIATNE